MITIKTYIYNQLSKLQIQNLCVRNSMDGYELVNIVAEIVKDIKTNGDKSLYKYALGFDKVQLEKLTIEKNELIEMSSVVGGFKMQAIQFAYKNILKFHTAQLQEEKKIQTMKGVWCWREARAIEKVGLYIPGGTAVLPSTFLMLAIPSQIAGCSEVVVCTPPQKNGLISPYLAYCALLTGVDKIYLAGGAQAIAAMAYGTQTIPKVNKIFGPGNQFVTKAKYMVQETGKVAIDMPAGPTEVLIIADKNANAAFTASDLLAQAEHGKDSQVVLVTTSQKLLKNVIQEIQLQITNLERKEIIKHSLQKSFAVLVKNLDEAMEFSNQYAPEHLIISVEDFQDVIPKIKNAGSVFLGKYTPEAAGDYASGTNHTLPTCGMAAAYSGISVDSFLKKISFQTISKRGIVNIGNIVKTFATIEKLQGHKNSVDIRLKSLTDFDNEPITNDDLRLATNNGHSV